MNIALITIHWANNYGAALQTYAMSEALKPYGNVNVIDYRSEKPAKGMQLLRLGTRPRDILRAGKDIFRLCPRYRVINKFKEFNKKYINITPFIVDDTKWQGVADENDVFIAGSDQIWNPEVVSEKGILDGRFFLDFVEDKTKFSYASSMGTHRYTKKQLIEVKGYLDDFKKISVREQDSAAYLKENVSKDVQTVVDPTLLLDKDGWVHKFGVLSEKKPYILVYALNKDSLLKRVVEAASVELGIDVISLDQDPFLNYQPTKHIKDAGPEEFISYFYNAKFVITNSFHGLCFSIIMEKNFLISNPLGSANRIESLLSSLGLSERRVVDSSSDSKISHSLSENIDYEAVTPKVERARQYSLAYLEEAINGT